MALVQNVPKHSARKFSWEGTKGVAEASDFGPLGTQIWSQVWDDSCDEGFLAVSPKTGREVLFCMKAEIRGEEDELLGWDFESYDRKRVDTFSITIFND